jgi:hypothetical protein
VIEVQAMLHNTSISELQQMYERQVKRGLIQESSTPQARSSASAELEAEAEGLQQDRLRHQEEREELELNHQAAVAAHKALFEAQMKALTEPQRKAAEKLDRAGFLNAFNTLRTFGNTESNFLLIRETVGNGNVTVFSVRQALASGVSLSSPTQEEKDQWAEDDAEEYKQRLKNASPMELRQMAAEERQTRAASMTQQEQAQADEARRLRDANRFPPIPDTINGVPLDANYIKKCSTDQLRNIVRRWGGTQVTNRLRGIS